MSAGTVLVVDDDRDLLSMVQMVLEGHGYAVLTADDGVAGLRLIHEQQVDVILLDIRMPHMDGLEMTQRLRDDPTTEDIPIILMSAHRALQGTSTLLPINGRLPKPFDLDTLFHVVDRWMPDEQRPSQPPDTADDPPRRPLRLLLTDVDVVLRPGGLIYEVEYRRAVQAHRKQGSPMPYADDDDE